MLPVAAGLLLLGGLLAQVRIRPAARPERDASELLALRERDDVNVVFVLVDTLRADHLGCYGYGRDTSPILDRFAEVGVRFARVRAQSSYTKTSMASIWTAATPPRHGIYRYSHALSEGLRLPAEILRDAGFETAGIYRNGWVAPNFGFGQGFDLYVRPAPSADPVRARRRGPGAPALQGTDLDVTEAAVEFLRGHRNRRFLLYLHYMDVHQYLYEEQSALFGTRYVDAYDNAIHWTDRNLGRLFKELVDLGIMDRTLVVIASDHGEGFYEHGSEGHARNLYAEVTLVPLVLSLPFRLPEPVVVEPLVRNIDIWPTVLDLLGLPPLPGAGGRSLLPLILAAARGEPQEPLAPQTAEAALDRTWGRVGGKPTLELSVTEWPWRLLAIPGDPDRVELYRLAEDPEERNDLAEDRPEVVARLLARVEAAVAGEPLPGARHEVELDDLRLQQLRALGYVIKQ